jgi:hypothetical protein
LSATVITWSVVLSRFGFNCRQILGHGPPLPLRIRPLDLIERLAMIAARISLHDARVPRKPFAFDEAIAIAAITTRSKIWRKI